VKEEEGTDWEENTSLPPLQARNEAAIFYDSIPRSVGH